MAAFENLEMVKSDFTQNLVDESLFIICLRRKRDIIYDGIIFVLIWLMKIVCKSTAVVTWSCFDEKRGVVYISCTYVLRCLFTIWRNFFVTFRKRLMLLESYFFQFVQYKKLLSNQSSSFFTQTNVLVELTKFFMFWVFWHHSVEITEYYCLTDVNWNQSWWF